MDKVILFSSHDPCLCPARSDPNLQISGIQLVHQPQRSHLATERAHKEQYDQGGSVTSAACHFNSTLMLSRDRSAPPCTGRPEAFRRAVSYQRTFAVFFTPTWSESTSPSHKKLTACVYSLCTVKPVR